MHLRNSSARLNTGSTDIVEFLEQARVCLGQSRKEWVDEIGLTKNEYSCVLARQSDVPIHVILNICEKYELSIESIQKGTVDLNVFYERASGAVGTLPDRYTIGAFSRRRSGAILFEWLEKRTGFYGRAETMRYFQIDPMTFFDPNESISVTFFSDVMSYASHRFGVAADEFRYAGEMSFPHLKGSSFTKELGIRPKVKDAYERMFSDLQSFWELNWEYKLSKVRDDSCVLTVKPRDEVLDALKSKQIGSVYTCSWKTGLFTIIPKLLGQMSARVRETHCVHRGDGYCQYEMRYFDHAAFRSS